MYPRVCLVQPDGEIALVAPARSSRRDRLLRRMRPQKISRAGQLEILLAELITTRQPQILLAVGGLSNEGFEEKRSFKPPVSEQLSVEWCDDDRVEIERAQFVQVLPADLEKVGRMFFSDGGGISWIVKIFVAIASCNPVILYAGKFPDR